MATFSARLTRSLALLGAILFTNASTGASTSILSAPGQSEEAAHQHAADETATAAQPIDGSKVYHDFCSVCHGDQGDGKSRAQAGLIPPPKDFTSPEAAVQLNRDYMIRIVSSGKPGTAMSGWSARLTNDEIEAVVDFIRNRFMPSITTEEEFDGRRIFAEFCSVCHGDRGQGAVWAQSGLKPPPANFTDPAVQAKLSRDRMIFSVTYGRPQTAMSSWKSRLDEQEIEAVVDYVRQSLMGLDEDAAEPVAHAHAGQQPAAAGGHDHDAHGAADIDEPLPYGLSGNERMGKDLYEHNCVACHGLQGDGQGPRAYFIFPKPRDFSHPAARAKYSRAHLFEVIAKGETGSEMPAWNKVLTDQEIAHLSEYVFTTFIRPDEGT